jgi:hypothetical protein
MTKEFFELLEKFIDAKITYEITSREEDEDGYRISAIRERKEVDKLRLKLETFFTYGTKS